MRSGNMDGLAKARAKQAADKASGIITTRKPKESSLRSDFAEDGRWLAMARKARITLPRWGTRATVGLLAMWATKLGIDSVKYQKNQDDFKTIIQLNPDWPLRALVGLMLEWKEDRT